MSTILICFCIPAHAQNYLTQTGSPTFTSGWPVELGYVNVGNGNLHNEIGIDSLRERGRVPFVTKLVYDSRIWQIVSGTSNTWQPTNVPNSQGGWRFVTSADPGTVASQSTSTTCLQGTTRVPGAIVHYNFTWTSADGTQRSFPITTRLVESSCGGIDKSTGSAFATDSSGFKMSVTNYTTVSSVIAPDGTQIYPSVKDTNGNYFSTDSNGNVIDTLGRTPVTKTVNGTQTTYAVLNAQGSTSNFMVTTGPITVSTHFGVSGVTDWSGSLTVVTALQLPDGKTYSFGYDSYGELNSITLPTGGVVSYVYGNFTDGLSGVNRWVNSHTSGGGATTFGEAVVATSNCPSGAQACQTQTVTKPDGSQAVYTFSVNNGAWKSQVQYKTGGSPNIVLETVSDTWNFANSCQLTNCTGSGQVQKLTETITLPTYSGGVTRAVQWTYDSVNDMNVSTLKEWKFYAGSQPTAPDRETDFTYQTASSYTSKNIINRVLTVMVKDGSGNLLAQTTLSYDDSGTLLNSTPSTGITNHDDTNFGLSNTIRGNPTKIQRCTNLAACGTAPVQTALTYDTTGQVLSVQDPNGNTTSMSYADNFYKDVGDGPANSPQAFPQPAATNAFVTSLTTPLIPATQFGYYWGTSQRAFTTDANGNTSYSHFFDSFNRPTSAVLPNGGWSYTAYAASETHVDSYTGITAAFSTSPGAGIRQDEALLDNLGRTTTQSLVSDPEGQTSVATSYDSSGRVQNTSLPYRSTSDTTYGLETPTYDGLNRTTKITHQDGTYSQVFFGTAVGGSGLNARTSQSCASSTYGLGYPVLFVDEAGKKREVWTDGLGKAIEGDEPDSSGNLTTGAVVCYSYDLLGNLLQATSGSQTRTYSYVAPSRLSTAKIPEISDASGNQCTLNYQYDSNGNITQRVAPAPNQTSCATQVTTTYSWDALNRLTKITYSDGTTPTVQYGYDGTALSGCATPPPSLSDSNPKGRRTSMCDGSGATSWSHDKVGGILTESRTIAGINKTVSYVYNLDGSPKSVTYPSIKTVTYTVSNAQRLTAAADTTSNTQFAITASYAPMGALQGMITGQVSGVFSGVTETRSYNNRLEYTSTQATSSVVTALNLSLCYTQFSLTTGCSSTASNNNGSVTGVTNGVDPGRTVITGYDSLNRISSESSQATSGADCWGQTLSPDTLGNLNGIGLSQCSGTTLNVTVDGNNHINSSSSYAYDAAGNMTQDGSGNGYTFDAEGRLTLASGMSGGPYCYVYDGNGLRVAKKSNSNSTCTAGTITKIYWRSISGDALAETDSSGSTTNSAYNEYVFLAGHRIASRNGTGGIFYYFADPLGTVRSVTTGNGPGQTSGQLCYDADFTPYGQEMQHSERLQTTACPPNYRFTGYEYDSETGLSYAFARYYSSRLGRFLSTDPIGGAVGNLQSHNAYTYTSNDPLNSVDPTGMVNRPGYDINLGSLVNMSLGILASAPGLGSNWNEFDVLQMAMTPTDYYRVIDTSNYCRYDYDCAPDQWVPIYGNIGLLGFLGGNTGTGWKDDPKSLILNVKTDCFDKKQGWRETVYELKTLSGENPQGQYNVTEQVSDTSLAPPWGQSTDPNKNAFDDTIRPSLGSTGTTTSVQYFLVSPNTLNNAQWVPMNRPEGVFQFNKITMTGAGFAPQNNVIVVNGRRAPPC